MEENKAILVLADGSSYIGKSFGDTGEKIGEVVFNTSITGYQEIISDPSYKNQIIIMTYPHIGNYGINKKDYESANIYADGIIVREYCNYPDNYRSEGSYKDLLLNNGIVGVEGLDTRSLVKKIRNFGTMMGIISTLDFDINSLMEKLKNTPHTGEKDMVKEVTTHAIYTKGNENASIRIALLDYGVKSSIIDNLVNRSCFVKIFPANTDANTILKENFHGVLLSNGPGNPEKYDYAINCVKNLINKIPIFGICLGHQILALALGLKTYKLKFGHRGANHPVKVLSTGKIEITSQNHGYAVDICKSTNNIIITHVNINDETNEGMYIPDINAFSVQFHPEASPGPHDANYLFDRFLKNNVL
jgi:carbamoyl-phosphate synthase small subunit